MNLLRALPVGLEYYGDARISCQNCGKMNPIAAKKCSGCKFWQIDKDDSKPKIYADVG